ncbi:hypothetical protein [Tenuibacillus multivorans]|uniref:DoxX protein n=1 Tax=Tenuibacillus multivorans TaxID=237069 RepID=A0A1H0DES0_9BACI|nr:hypothetical protein [Tenuibacillus multivorans]GEL76583.1 hypothetical protein TMU01_08180 [Tenuibacillus multivorans]SDN68598.1 hypothetical protein SAMN05216498_2842 [Tenuibacillus multivorans]
MNVIKSLPRLLLGFIFLVAGINGYVVILGLDPFIATSPEAMALFDFQYLLIAEKTLEIVCGALLLFNRFVPLVLAVLSPIVANIFLLHLFVDHSLLLLAILIAILHSYLLMINREYYIPLFVRKTRG